MRWNLKSLKFSFIIFLAVFLFFIQSAFATTHDYIIDTDVGIDDVIAILYLLNHPDVNVKAITIDGDGNAHCKPAAENIAGLLQLMHQTNIPLACGRATPLAGHHTFPDDVLKMCDTLSGVALDKPKDFSLPKQSAKDLMTQTLQNAKQPMIILAIGPLTTIAEVLEAHPTLKDKIEKIVIMGGAVKVKGNIRDVILNTHNLYAEWNIYIDPLAAKKVFHAKVPIVLVPLDVTNTVLIDHDFYQRIQKNHSTPASTFVYQLLDSNKKMLLDKIWYFWDPMAAVISVDPSIATIETLPLTVQLAPEPHSGATIIDKKQGDPIKVSVGIKSDLFKKVLLDGLNRS
ncbi:MAG: nucleoside hydrolase [Gammaproteobacteria bacterium]|nr:nucleoside hydrolase [Gammaproteobacteria bacterium]